MASSGFGSGSFGTFPFGGPVVPGTPPFSDEQYLRNYLNDTINVGDSYSQTNDTFNIVNNQNTVTLSKIPTQYKPIAILLNLMVVNPANYMLANNVITFNFNLLPGSVVIVFYWR